MSLTARQLEILRKMAAAHAKEDFDGCEIVSEGKSVYLDLDKISWKTLNAFIDHCAVSLDECTDGKYQRWSINGTGLLIARKPEMADEIWLRLRSGKPFTFKDEKIEDM